LLFGLPIVFDSNNEKVKTGEKAKEEPSGWKRYKELTIKNSFITHQGWRDSIQGVLG
jgi:hypothetical protein